MLAVRTLELSSNARRHIEYLLNASWRGNLNDIVGTLAKGAIRMRNAVRMDVSQLYRGAENQKNREESHEQNAG